MKKIIISSLIVMAAAALFVACSKEVSTVSPVDKVTMTAYIPNDFTKVSFTPDANLDGPVKLAWEGTDKIRVIDHNDASNNSQFEIQAGYTDHEASFSGDPVSATSYDILYPGTMESIAEAEDVQFGIQTQTNNAATSQLAYMALLTDVDTYDDVEFSEAWATAHKGTFKQTGILRLRIQLPDGFSDEEVASVTVNAPSAIFYKSNALVSGEKVSSLKLNFTGGANPDAGVITGYVMLPWTDMTIAANTTLSVIVETAEHKFYTKSFTPSTSVTLTMGRVNAIKINKSGFGAASTTFAGGSGTAADPWLIATPAHMQNISTNLTDGVMKYFKLIDDIDLQGINWSPVITAKPYTRYINFDGNYKTISNLNTKNNVGYPSLFGVFNGIAKNLTIADAQINHTTSGTDVAGVLASYAGAGDISINPIIDGIIIRNCIVGSDASRITSYTGGLVGQIENDNVTISNSQVINTNIYGPSTNTGAAGGIVGYVKSGATIEGVAFIEGSVFSYKQVGGIVGAYAVSENKTATLSRSYSTGAVSASYRWAGGLVGSNVTAKTNAILSITDCYETGDVNASAYAGGLLGTHNSTSATNITNCFAIGKVSISWGGGGIVAQCAKANLNLIRCMAFNYSISTSVGDSDPHYSSGAIIGYGKDVAVTVNYCFRGNALASKFNDCKSNSANIIEDHAFITTAANIPQRYSLQYGYYHHGQNTNLSLCDLIHSGTIGGDWDSNIWDWRGSIPTLK